MSYKKRKNTKRRDIYKEVTDRVITALENGAKGKDWKMPWHNRGAEAGFPSNIHSENLYGGINVVNLWLSASAGGFKSDVWGTYKQWSEKGHQVKKGSSSSQIIFYKSYEVSETKRRDDEDSGQRMALKYYSVFNADQVEGYQAPEIKEAPSLVTRIEQADNFVKNTGAVIKHGGTRAYYSESQNGDNYIQMPEPSRFMDTDTSTATEGYYGTLLHEQTHWTKHPKRLDRRMGKRFGKQSRAAEELVAELGSAFLCTSLGITAQPRQDHFNYIASWLNVLKNEKKAIFTAAARAQNAADYLYKLQEQQKNLVAA